MASCGGFHLVVFLLICPEQILTETKEKVRVTTKNGAPVSAGIQIAGLNHFFFSLKGCKGAILGLAESSVVSDMTNNKYFLVQFNVNRHNGIKDNCHKCASFNATAEMTTMSCKDYKSHYVMWDNNGSVKIGERTDFPRNAYLSYTTTNKFSINYVYVTSSRSKVNWIFEKGNTSPPLPVHMETSDVEMTTKGSYKPILVNQQGIYIWSKKMFSFDIKGCSDIFIQLSATPVVWSKASYTVHIKKLAAETSYGKGKGISTRGIGYPCDEFVPFFITWDKLGHVKVGPGSRPNDTRMTFTADEPITPVYVYIISQNQVRCRFHKETSHIDMRSYEPESDRSTSIPFPLNSTSTEMSMNKPLSRTTISQMDTDTVGTRASDNGTHEETQTESIYRTETGDTTESGVTLESRLETSSTSSEHQHPNASRSLDHVTTTVQMVVYKDNLFKEKLNKLPAYVALTTNLFVDIHISVTGASIHQGDCATGSGIGLSTNDLLLRDGCPVHHGCILLKSDQRHLRFELDSSLLSPTGTYIVCNVTLCSDCGPQRCPPTTVSNSGPKPQNKKSVFVGPILLSNQSRKASLSWLLVFSCGIFLKWIIF